MVLDADQTVAMNRTETQSPFVDSEVLSIQDLSMTIQAGSRVVNVLRRINVSVRKGEIVALVGESGSGKTLTGRTALGFVPNGANIRGCVTLGGQNVFEASSSELRKLRGGVGAMIFQEPSLSLNPVFPIEWQMSEGLRAHGVRSQKERSRIAIKALEEVGIANPEHRIKDFPHQFSGGQNQRIMIAMALCLKPSLIVADEPTTALDVTVQRDILDLLRDLRVKHGAAILLITHNMGVVADLADRVVVLKGGQVVEEANVFDLFAKPREEYTQTLLASVPHLTLTEPQKRASETSTASSAERQPVAALSNVSMEFKTGFRRKITALNNVSFEIGAGEILGVVGESGSGKTTLGRILAGLQMPSSGTVSLFGSVLSGGTSYATRLLRRDLGFVFQDAASSFNPFLSVFECVAEPLRIHEPKMAESDVRFRVLELLDMVELSEEFEKRLPLQLSGGQRQRLGIARALVLDPKLVVADEPTSALDVTVQKNILKLFRSSQKRLGFSSLFITHDLAVVQMVADRLLVVKDGVVVEHGPTQRVLSDPTHSYTRTLLAAAPVPDPVRQRRRFLT